MQRQEALSKIEALIERGKNLKTSPGLGIPFGGGLPKPVYDETETAAWSSEAEEVLEASFPKEFPTLANRKRITQASNAKTTGDYFPQLLGILQSAANTVRDAKR